MESRRFDAIARALASGVSRRQLLKAALAGTAASLLPSRAGHLIGAQSPVCALDEILCPSAASITRSMSEIAVSAARYALPGGNVSTVSASRPSSRPPAAAPNTFDSGLAHSSPGSRTGIPPSPWSMGSSARCCTCRYPARTRPCRKRCSLQIGRVEPASKVFRVKSMRARSPTMSYSST